MHERDIPKLFKLYGFLDSSKELNTKGIGIGLYICKKIVNIFGGEISVTSELNKGTSFKFSFKLSELASNDKPNARILNPSYCNKGNVRVY